MLSEERVEELEAEAKETVQAAVEYAQEAEYPGVETATGPVYAEEVQNG